MRAYMLSRPHTGVVHPDVGDHPAERLAIAATHGEAGAVQDERAVGSAAATLELGRHRVDPIVVAAQLVLAGEVHERRESVGSSSSAIRRRSSPSSPSPASLKDPQVLERVPVGGSDGQCAL
jgi:hypothetical protein